MKTAYRVLAYLIVAEVVVQAAAIAYGFFGFGKYIEDGNVVTKASIESNISFDGLLGLIVHGINGQIGVPLIGLALLVVALIGKIGIRQAVTLFVMIAVQVGLGLLAHGIPVLGALHGLNAIGIALMAFVAARSVGVPRTATVPAV
jgi:hypothetical protein